MVFYDARAACGTARVHDARARFARSASRVRDLRGGMTSHAFVMTSLTCACAPSHAVVCAREFRHRLNHGVSERRRLGFPRLGHVDTWLVDSLQLLVEENHGVLLFPDWSNASDFLSTPETFGTVPLHSNELGAAIAAIDVRAAAERRGATHASRGRGRSRGRSGGRDKRGRGRSGGRGRGRGRATGANAAPPAGRGADAGPGSPPEADGARADVADGAAADGATAAAEPAIKLTADQSYICRAMGTQLPPLPVHGPAEYKLFSQLALEQQAQGLDDRKMAITWCDHCDGIEIFPKLPVYLRTYHKKFESNARVRDAVQRAERGHRALEALNKATLATATAAAAAAATAAATPAVPAAAAGAAAAGASAGAAAEADDQADDQNADSATAGPRADQGDVGAATATAAEAAAPAAPAVTAAGAAAATAAGAGGTITDAAGADGTDGATAAAVRGVVVTVNVGAASVGAAGATATGAAAAGVAGAAAAGTSTVGASADGLTASAAEALASLLFAAIGLPPVMPRPPEGMLRPPGGVFVGGTAIGGAPPPPVLPQKRGRGDRSGDRKKRTVRHCPQCKEDHKEDEDVLGIAARCAGAAPVPAKSGVFLCSRRHDAPWAPPSRRPRGGGD